MPTIHFGAKGARWLREQAARRAAWRARLVAQNDREQARTDRLRARTVGEYRARLLAQRADRLEEFRFHGTRKWRFDFAWPGHKIALEQEGGAFIGGRHTRGAGYVKDLEKYSEAAILGWRILRCTPKQVKDGTAVTLAKRALSVTEPER